MLTRRLARMACSRLTRGTKPIKQKMGLTDSPIPQGKSFSRQDQIENFVWQANNEKLGGLQPDVWSWIRDVIPCFIGRHPAGAWHRQIEKRPPPWYSSSPSTTCPKLRNLRLSNKWFGFYVYILWSTSVWVPANASSMWNICFEDYCLRFFLSHQQ